MLDICTGKAHNSLMNFTAHAEFGTSPVGTEVASWDWSEDDYGFRFRSEFNIIPDEAIEVTVPWSEVSMSGLVETVAPAGSPEDYATRVVRYTVSQGNGDFIASTWVRYAEAARDFVGVGE